MSLRVILFVLFCSAAYLAPAAAGLSAAMADGDGEGGEDGGESGEDGGESGEDGGEDSDSGHDAEADDAAKGRKAGNVKALDELMKIATDRFPGKIVGTEFKTKKGMQVYEFHILQVSGRVRGIKVNARTGAILKKD